MDTIFDPVHYLRFGWEKYAVRKLLPSWSPLLIRFRLSNIYRVLGYDFDTGIQKTASKMEAIVNGN